MVEVRDGEQEAAGDPQPLAQRRQEPLALVLRQAAEPGLGDRTGDGDPLARDAEVGHRLAPPVLGDGDHPLGVAHEAQGARVPAAQAGLGGGMEVMLRVEPRDQVVVGGDERAGVVARRHQVVEPAGGGGVEDVDAAVLDGALPEGGGGEEAVRPVEALAGEGAERRQRPEGDVGRRQDLGQDRRGVGVLAAEEDVLVAARGRIEAQHLAQLLLGVAPHAAVDRHPPRGEQAVVDADAHQPTRATMPARAPEPASASWRSR